MKSPSLNLTGSDALVRLQSNEDSGNNVSQGPVMVNNIFALKFQTERQILHLWKMHVNIVI
ncbi:hypothetical protein Pyn_05742 [Prunus yedoensis var. nudiflora]|uniref:Uncharacterized protein n=1 Tax=Prunus yedoensis var. nudiflora TaxID=2094558 RepID=A0A314YD37_PRUYE|nr:hypothetical protein Pyn_05742 [Prunus yedoensis var. nudiflora]